MSYLPIEHHGIIGDMHTVALVGRNGTIDWWCYPSFDSPSVFGSILDDQKGGAFEISPTCGGVTTRQMYFPDTNVLITRFQSRDGVAEIMDFMPAGNERNGWGRIVRQVRCVRGSMPLQITCRPAFDYARARHKTLICPDGACFRTSELRLSLATHVPLRIEGDGVTGSFYLNEGEAQSFLLGEVEADAECLTPESDERMAASLNGTIGFWRTWLSQCTYRGRWRETVYRSALALKLMTYEPTGAIVAAPTTSLPEGIGGERNWDYRYTWMRDASFTLYALMRVGFTDEAGAFMDWLSARLGELNLDGSLQTMYSIDGRHTLTEETLDHLDGYEGSKPVRIGNGAYNQLQLDIAGELLDAVYLYNKYGAPIGYDIWRQIRRLLNWVVDNWQRADEGIWEVRGGSRHFVYSKMMCWVALDRGLRLADKRSFPADRARWLETRDTIYEEIMDKGWNAERRAFVQSYGSSTLDASNLMMPLVFFVSPRDPRMESTLDATLKELVSDSLVYRYDPAEAPDGLLGTEGTFSICTFWLVEALTRAGRTEEARYIFEQMLGYANHLGLYSEEIGQSGEALGNFPQAFTHIALISAAYNLDRALGRGVG